MSDRRLHERQRGANVIEFALTLPFFLALLLGVLDYGWIYASQSGIDAAVALGCREGAMRDSLHHSPKTTASNEITKRAAPWCDGKACVIAVSDKWSVPDRALECTVDLPFSGLTGFVPAPSMLRAHAIYRLEWQREGNL